MKLTRNAGEEVLPLLEGAEGEVTVYSPFISPEYAELLLERSEDGIDVRVFTAEANADYHRKSLRILRSGPELPKTLRNAGLLLVSLGVVAALAAYSLELLTLPLPLLLFVGGAAGGGYLLKKHLERADEWSESHGNIDIQTVKNLHAKLYSRDRGEEVVFGSANLTNAGLRRNLEVVSEHHDKSPLHEGESNGMYA